MAKEQTKRPTYEITRTEKTNLEEGGYNPPPVAHVKRPPAPPPAPKKKD